MGAINSDGIEFIDDLEGTRVTDDNLRKPSCTKGYLIQRYSAVTILGTFDHTTPEDEF